MRVRIKDIIAPHFWGTFNSKITHQIDKGGRGSTKTSKNSIKIDYHCLSEEKCSAVIIRRYQNTLRNSVYKEIKRGLARFKLEDGIDYEETADGKALTEDDVLIHEDLEDGYSEQDEEMIDDEDEESDELFDTDDLDDEESIYDNDLANDNIDNDEDIID